RTARADLPEHEIITLGGFGVWENVRDMVREFNRNSQTHQIEIRDYYTSGSDTMEDFFTAEFRFMMDVLTGQAPDIIVGSPSSLATLAERDLLVDLYSLIDADPVLSRDDFLPNILRTMEAPDGSLPMISNSFIIETIIGLADVVGDIESWTFAEMLALIERAEAAGMEFFLAEFFTAERFLHTAILYSDEDFIDWSENRVNVDNEAFIQLLEIAYRLPHVMADHSMEEWMALPDPIIRMLRGEQLIDFVDIRDIDAYQMLAGMLGEDFVALGMPTRDGGAHAVRASAGFAISATSTQQDAAWSFIRRALMPYFDGMNEEEALGWRFPLRVDLYEAMIVEARTPLMEIDADGNEEEVPRGGRGGGHFMVYLYAMTEAEERGFRAIVETASIAGRFDDRVMEMILEETLPFFAGDRSAADTARILQNRLQMYLSERR
ncbi:MAG: extracellular solute-binding protein, partial [Oscillospiraceae bacterium]|nr:extracellular solute-binding protein [Oscillospiraceae bacterium]